MNLNKILLFLIILKNYNSELIQSLSQNINIPGNNIVKLIGLEFFSYFIRQPLRMKINNQFKETSYMTQNLVDVFYHVATSIPFLFSLYLHYQNPNKLPKKYLLQFLAYNMGVQLSGIYSGNFLNNSLCNYLQNSLDSANFKKEDENKMIDPKSKICQKETTRKNLIQLLTIIIYYIISKQSVIKNIPESYFIINKNHVTIIFGNSHDFLNMLYQFLTHRLYYNHDYIKRQ